MESDDKSMIWMFGILMSAIAAIIMGSMWLYGRHVERMAELGYEETTVPGNSHTVWVRSK